MKTGYPQQQEVVLGLLRKASLRHTRPRSEILGLLHREHGPFSAQEVFSRMSKGICDLVTVYRCLEAFEEAQLVRRCDFSDGIVRFELFEEDHHHHHLICRKCGSVEKLDLETCPMDKLEKTARAKGYSAVQHSLEIFGICPDCQTAKPSKSASRPKN